jgi:PTH1 family peptidyl-tRNA hydrolase
MNRSGLAVRQVCDYYKIGLENSLVICDDFNLPFGTLRFRKQGSDGGHNGLKSLIYQLQTDNFSRLRFGIGSPSTATVEFVLDKFNQEETGQLTDLRAICSQAICTWLTEGIDQTMAKFNKNFTNENG